ncbi:collagen-binding domain-containing protein [Ornithinimicrobium humiphilum]|uniref:collagen-binding domain-containing protein n=1 Tax=Ornithinimicrobium humiphilum TaxID=125288 RepID=UPI003CD09A77
MTAAGSASAETTTINPFATNNGFSIVAKGNATLGNNEIEGSIAAFGSIAATSSNYPLVHKVAGVGDCAIPTIDGDPRPHPGRSFVGIGNIAVTNAGHGGGPRRVRRDRQACERGWPERAARAATGSASATATAAPSRATSTSRP